MKFLQAGVNRDPFRPTITQQKWSNLSAIIAEHELAQMVDFQETAQIFVPILLFNHITKATIS